MVVYIVYWCNFRVENINLEHGLKAGHFKRKEPCGGVAGMTPCLNNPFVFIVKILIRYKECKFLSGPFVVLLFY